MLLCAQERRRRRSANVIVALTYWLEATARRLGVDGLTLVDGNGFLIASNLPHGHAGELASMAPTLAHPDADGVRPVDEHGIQVSILALPSQSGSLLLCAIGGGDAAQRDGALPEVACGVRRIIHELVGGAAWGVL